VVEEPEDVDGRHEQVRAVLLDLARHILREGPPAVLALPVVCSMSGDEAIRKRIAKRLMK
jgi:hypothetical protein